MTRLLFLLLFLIVACHRAEVLENVPTTTSLGKFRTAGLVFARADGQQSDKDDLLADVHDAVKDKIEGTGVFKSVNDGPAGELLIRVLLLSGGGDKVMIGVEFVDPKSNALLGRFQVSAQPDRDGPKTGTLNLDFDSKMDKAIASAAREIGDYIEEHK